jgi:uncharacterized zinc-type alcohol dehydrogenase-like protein
MKANSFAAFDSKSPLKTFQFERRNVEANDVQIDIHYCGVCHSDLHTVNGDWGPQQYPLVPGHEIVGRVESVGASTSKFKVGDWVGVGCFVDSCRSCSPCHEGEEQYCERGATFTYGAADPRGGYTQGGYSTKIVVDEKYVLRIPQNIPLQNVAPLLCAGITTYSPLRHWKVQPGQKVAVAGLGGLGHMGVKLAVAMGAKVTVLSTSERKRADALKLGAHDFLITKDADQMAKAANSFDLILNAISADHNYDAYLNLVKHDGTMVLLGVPGPQKVSAMSLLFKRKSLAGSLIGGIAETQEMLDFCSKHNIGADVEVIPMQQINEAYERMVKSDVHYRFVIDMKSLK